MKLKYLFIFAALTGLAAAGPVPNDQAAAVVPDWVDTDGVEGISLAELQAFVESRRGAAKTLFEQWDENGNGVLDPDEIEAAKEALRLKAEEKLGELFDAVAGEDGLVDEDEFYALTPVANLPEGMAEQIFTLLDTNGNGEVSKEEFLAAVGPQ